MAEIPGIRSVASVRTETEYKVLGVEVMAVASEEARH